MANQQPDWDGDDYNEDEEDYEGTPSLQSSADLQDELDNIKHEDQLSHSSKDSQQSDDEEDIHMDKSNHSCIEIMDDQIPFSLPNQVKITNPYMSKYEKAAIIGKRAEQIANGSPIYISIDWQSQNLPNPLEVAEQELKEGKIPFIVRRKLPNGQFEDWKIEDLLI